MTVSAQTAATATGKAGAGDELTAYGAACRAAALLDEAEATASKNGAHEHAMSLVSVAAGWRELATALNGGARSVRPIAAPKPKEDDQPGR